MAIVFSVLWLAALLLSVCDTAAGMTDAFNTLYADNIVTICGDSQLGDGYHVIPVDGCNGCNNRGFKNERTYLI